PDLGSGARACRFKSCYPHSKRSLDERSSRLLFLAQKPWKQWSSGKVPKCRFEPLGSFSKAMLAIIILEFGRLFVASVARWSNN
ncbi:MAG: hypothetical protein MJ131_10695, partial [Lachnospiraceae bacterium]|nr:hypothetical protein [Lachnospiraceae bacterium]